MIAETAPLRAQAETYQKEAGAWARERAFLRAGLTDPEGQAVAEALYGKLPEQDRPALEEWLGAVKADPTKARALSVYWGSAPPAATPPTATPATPPPATPPATTPTVPRTETTPSAGSTVTPAAISAAYREALRSGNWAPYEALRAQTLAELRR